MVSLFRFRVDRNPGCLSHALLCLRRVDSRRLGCSVRDPDGKPTSRTAAPCLARRGSAILERGLQGRSSTDRGRVRNAFRAVLFHGEAPALRRSRDPARARSTEPRALSGLRHPSSPEGKWILDGDRIPTALAGRTLSGSLPSSGATRAPWRSPQLSRSGERAARRHSCGIALSSSAGSGGWRAGSALGSSDETKAVSAHQSCGSCALDSARARICSRHRALVERGARTSSGSARRHRRPL